MEVAGAVLLAHNEFGTYNGAWWARVNWIGKIGWVHGSYGSCPICDAFEAEFDTSYHDIGNDTHSVYNLFAGCRECKDVQFRMVWFGCKYLDDILSQEDAERIAGKHADESNEDYEALEFVKSFREI
jgi:hypothetical protein